MKKPRNKHNNTNLAQRRAASSFRAGSRAPRPQRTKAGKPEHAQAQSRAPGKPGKRGGSSDPLRVLKASFKALEKQCNHYANLYDFAPVGYVIFDGAGRIKDINKPGALLLGYQHARLVGRCLSEFVDPEDRTRFEEHLARCRREPGRINTELSLRDIKGTVVPVEIVSVQFQSMKEPVTQYRTAILDITQRRRAQEEVRRLQQDYGKLLNSLDSIVWEAVAGPLSWEYTFISNQAERLLGHVGTSWSERSHWLDQYLHPDDRPAVMAARQKAVAQGKNYRIEYRMITAGKQVLWLRDNVTVTRLPDHCYKLQGIAVNVTALKEGEQAIRKSYDELEKRVLERTMELTRSYEELQQAVAERQRLEHELLEITEAERHRIALDLHDDLGQRLAGLSLMLKSLQVKLAKRGIPEVEDAAKLHGVVSQTIERAHDLTHQLSAWENENPGLENALRALAERAAKLFNIACEVKVTGAVPTLDANTTNQLYKIAQEATTNGIKHGQARQVQLQITARADQLELTVTNDGRPFPKLLNPRGGFGLRIMQYRANLVGGTLEIRPNGDEGTVVRCTLSSRAEKGSRNSSFESAR